MDNPPLTVFAEFRAAPGKEKELAAILKGLIEPTRKEQGCLQYDLRVDNDAPGHLYFYENWTSLELLQAHLASPHLAAAEAKWDALLAEPVRVTLATRIA